jgi:hypothetical protein
MLAVLFRLGRYPTRAVRIRAPRCIDQGGLDRPGPLDRVLPAEEEMVPGRGVAQELLVRLHFVDLFLPLEADLDRLAESAPRPLS